MNRPVFPQARQTQAGDRHLSQPPQRQSENLPHSVVTAAAVLDDAFARQNAAQADQAAPEGRGSLLQKVKMCKFYGVGKCKKGARCSYAHDESELREVPNLNRTKICPKLRDAGVCNNTGCRFAHKKDELRVLYKRNGKHAAPAQEVPTGEQQLQQAWYDQDAHHGQYAYDTYAQQQRQSPQQHYITMSIEHDGMHRPAPPGNFHYQVEMQYQDSYGAGGYPHQDLQRPSQYAGGYPQKHVQDATSETYRQPPYQEWNDHQINGSGSEGSTRDSSMDCMEMGMEASRWVRDSSNDTGSSENVRSDQSLQQNFQAGMPPQLREVSFQSGQNVSGQNVSNPLPPFPNCHSVIECISDRINAVWAKPRDVVVSITCWDPSNGVSGGTMIDCCRRFPTLTGHPRHNIINRKWNYFWNAIATVDEENEEGMNAVVKGEKRLFTCILPATKAGAQKIRLLLQMMSAHIPVDGVNCRFFFGFQADISDFYIMLQDLTNLEACAIQIVTDSIMGAVIG